jgi:ppGpp synthetase/RelA/SpoT-type nucleotidyltranferase
MPREKILKEYDSQFRTLNNLSHSVKSLINTLLTSENIIAHTVSSRVKEKESLSNKIDKKDKYTELNEVTDIVGIRIITHYSDDVDKVATLLEKEFDIDNENSIDKRKILDPDRFGYLSLHYISELNKERLKLAEYKQFKGIKFEIQIRSILQHTWAEIEHDIGYKSKAEVPREIRRQFSRLAGLLEIADSEFVNIRNSLNDYEKYVGDTILVSPKDINIDAISLYQFINTSDIVQKIDSKIVKILDCTLISTDQKKAARLIKNLEYFGITTILELLNILKVNEKK